MADKNELQVKMEIKHNELKEIIDNPDGIDETALSKTVDEICALCGAS